MHNAIEALSGYEAEIGRLLWMLEDTRRRTNRSLDGLQPAVVDWSDLQGGNSIGTLLYHLAAIEIDWLHADVLQKPWSLELETLFPFDVRDEQGHLIGVRGLSLDAHLRRLGAVRSILLDAFRGMSLDEFRRVRRTQDHDVTPEWVLHHLMQHEAEHRGQIGEIRLRAEAH
jgi:uncharacterized damage-inducible protein DinB